MYGVYYRTKDLETFLEQTRLKFVGFKVANDTDSLAGLPKPIHEGVRVLKDHIYVSLVDHQIKREEEIAKHPLSKVIFLQRNNFRGAMYWCMFCLVRRYGLNDV